SGAVIKQEVLKSGTLIINDLANGNYLVSVYTQDEAGNKSVAQESTLSVLVPAADGEASAVAATTTGKTPKTPKTGDASLTRLWTFISAAAIFVIVLMVLANKKKATKR
ncbi:MAG: hypothetical protein RR504_07305, partial [Christensenellaceae bacterium]